MVADYNNKDYNNGDNWLTHGMLQGGLNRFNWIHHLVFIFELFWYWSQSDSPCHHPLNKIIITYQGIMMISLLNYIGIEMILGIIKVETKEGDWMKSQLLIAEMNRWKDVWEKS